MGTHTELTGAEIKSLPEETRLYESVGRMFMLSTRAEITDALDKKQENCKEKIKNLEANKTYLERSMKDSENSLRELVAQKKAQKKKKKKKTFKSPKKKKKKKKK